MSSSSATETRQGLTLRANVSWTLVGNVVYAACQWGILVVLARLGSPEMVGLFALGLTISVPPIMFASLRMRRVQATDARDEHELGEYLAVRLASTAAALLAIAALVALFGYQGEAALVILAIGVSKAVESVSDVYYGQLQKKDRLDLIARSMIIKGPLSLLALAAAVALTGSVFWGVVGLIASWTVILFCFDLPRAAMANPGKSGEASLPWRKQLLRRGGPSGDGRRLAHLAWVLLPLGFVGLLSSLQVNVPRFFVEQHFGAGALGLFAALLYFDRVGTLVIDALGNSASPRLSRYYATSNRGAYMRLLGGLCAGGVLLALAGVSVGALFGEEVVTLVYGPEYAQQELLVRLLVAAGLAYVASLLNQGISAARLFNVQAPLYLVVSATLVVSCLLLVPTGGLNGAANALILARAVELGGTFLIAVYALATISRRRRGAHLLRAEHASPTRGH